MTNLTTRKISKILSLLLILSMLFTPATSFAAAADDEIAYPESVADENLVVNDENVIIYDVNDGNNFEAIVKTLRTRNYESIVGFDLDGTKLFNCTSYLASTSYTNARIRQSFANSYGTTIVHNHPSNSSFSGQDLYTEASYNTARIIVVSNLYIYVLEPTTDGWGEPSAMRTYYQQIYDYYYQYTRDFLNSYRYTKAGLLAKADTPDDGSFQWFYENALKASFRANYNATPNVQTGIWITHRTMLDVAQHFKLSYYRCATDDFDYSDTSIFYSEAVARKLYQDYTGRRW